MEPTVIDHECRKNLVEKKSTPYNPYLFLDSGLPNVYLSGIKVFSCTVCGKMRAEIPAVSELMNAIARAIVTKTSPLTGKEVQFLRKRVGIKQTDFANMIDASPEQLSRWENDHNQLSGAMDRFIRLAYAFISHDSKLKDLVQQVKEEFQKWSTSIHASETEERILAEYKTNRKWMAEAESLAA